MNELIKKKVLAKDWTFNEISNLKTTIESLSQEIYSEMTLKERFDLLREVRVNENWVGLILEDVIRDAVMTSLKGEVAGIIREMLNTATVNFGDNNEISERSMGGKSNSKRSSNEKKSSSNEE
jgi:anaerobic ribonucleoside-triphosphate reductase